jgi:hypothetical protein
MGVSCAREKHGSRSRVLSLLSPFLLLAASIAFLPAPAYADTFINYYVMGAAFASGATLTGTFQIDVNDVPYSSNGVTYITAANLTVTEPDSTAFNFSCPDAVNGNECIVYDSAAGYTQYMFQTSTGSQYLDLFWPISSSTDSFSFITGQSNGGSFCLSCTSPGQPDFLVSGEAVDPPDGAPLPAPEPATGRLLVAGLFGLAFINIRRKAMA